MTPQDIADLYATAHERIAASHRREREAAEVERARVRSLCAQHVGHVWGTGAAVSYSVRGGRVCLLCQACEVGRGATGEGAHA